jgi:hypothetical protein
MSRSCPAPTRALRQCAQIADLGWPRSVDTIEPDRLHLGPALAAQCTRAHYHVHVAGILVEQRLAEGPRYPARERNPEVVTLTMRVDVFQPPPAPCFYDFKSLSAAPPIPAMPTIDKPGSRADEPPLRLARPDCSRSSPSNRPGWWLLWFVDERRCVPRLALSIREMMAGERHWRG